MFVPAGTGVGARWLSGAWVRAEAFTGCGKRRYFANNPEIRPSVAKANADLIDLIGMAKAMPLQN